MTRMPPEPGKVMNKAEALADFNATKYTSAEDDEASQMISGYKPTCQLFMRSTNLQCV